MSNSEKQVEQEIQDKGLNAPRLTPDHINSKIALEMYFTGSGIIDAQTHGHHLGLMRFQHHDGEDLHKPMETLTFCILVLKNGFTVTGESACASPENFDSEIGRKIAYENARNKVWMLEGYLLKQNIHEANTKASSTPQERVCLEQCDLHTKLNALESFLSKGQPSFIDDEQWSLLQEQRNYMNSYNDILMKRIEKF